MNVDVPLRLENASEASLENADVCLFFFLCVYSTVNNLMMTKAATGAWALLLLLPFYTIAPLVFILKSASEFRTEGQRRDARNAGGLSRVNLSLVTPFKPS